MTDSIQIPEHMDRDIYLEIKGALGTNKVDYSAEAVESHYTFLDIEGHFEGLDNDFHRRQRIRKYAEAFAEFAGDDSVTAAQQKALAKVRAEKEDKPETKKEKQNGVEKKPRNKEPEPEEAPQPAPREPEAPAPVRQPEAVGKVKQDDSGIDWQALQRPFDYSEIEWRIGHVNKDKMQGSALPYITNRAVMDRLDEVVGPGNWQNDFVPGPNGGVLCKISIRVNGEWVAKFDGADNTNIEGVKGGLSDSMKRAAVQWGMGRYLYNAKIFWYDVVDSGRSHRFKDYNLKPKLEFES